MHVLFDAHSHIVYVNDFDLDMIKKWSINLNLIIKVSFFSILDFKTFLSFSTKYFISRGYFKKIYFRKFNYIHKI